MCTVHSYASLILALALGPMTRCLCACPAVQRAFWSLLLHSKVQFEALAAAVHNVDKAIRDADRSYKLILARHSQSVKIVRLYGKVRANRHFMAVATCLGPHILQV